MSLKKTAEEAYRILLRLHEAVKDEHGQPLVCYGCAHSAAHVPNMMFYSTGDDQAYNERTAFPRRKSLPVGDVA